MFENGVSQYDKGKIMVDVYFPPGKAICQWCPYCKNEDSLKRHKCMITGEYLVFPFLRRGFQCPIVMESEES